MKAGVGGSVGAVAESPGMGANDLPMKPPPKGPHLYEPRTKLPEAKWRPATPEEQAFAPSDVPFSPEQQEPLREKQRNCKHDGLIKTSYPGVCCQCGAELWQKGAP